MIAPPVTCCVSARQLALDILGQLPLGQGKHGMSGIFRQGTRRTRRGLSFFNRII
jgi:hypothetical protein